MTTTRTTINPSVRNHRPLLFTAIVLLLLIVLEIVARIEFPAQSAFWSAVDSAQQPVDVLFIGSSRVAAAIEPEVFQSELPGNATVINAAAGYSTPAEFYLALRNTFRRQPERLRNAVIFVEAPGGMPEPTRWSDPWAHLAAPEMLTPLLRRNDLERSWSHAQESSITERIESRLQIAFDYAFRFSTLVTNRLPFGRRFLAFAERPLIKFLNRNLGNDHEATPADLTTAGGIRTDVEGILAARKVAHDYANEMLKDQKLIDWNATVVADLVTLAQQYGARVVFFQTPLHSLHRAIYETPVRTADRAQFEIAARNWHTPVLQLDFKTVDDDFPDIWHLKKSLAADYTRAIATAWRQNQ